MPSGAHEGVRLLFQNRPELIRELARAVGVDVPAGVFSEAANAFSDLSPPTYAADLVLAIRGAAGEARLVVEVQGAIAEAKRFAWPRYAATVHAEHRCPTWVIVIATNERVAAWARRPITTFQPGCGFVPVVIGPSDVPRITDLEAARAAPELAVLSALMHRDDEDGVVAATAIEAAFALDRERGRLYMDLVLGSLRDVVRAAVEGIMRDRGYEPLTEIGREMFHKGRTEGRTEGRTDALRATIAKLCRSFGVAWTEERAAAVAALDEAGLEALLDVLLSTRRWPSH